MFWSVMSVLKGLMTPLIGVIALYIAWQQWKGNELKLKMERYERRLRIYEEVVKLLKTVCRDFAPEWHGILNFIGVTAEAEFLFGPEIPLYINEIFTRANALRVANLEYRSFKDPPPPSPDYDPNKVLQEIHAQSNWFTEQLTVALATGKFRKYLDIT
jgi:hypothetical protein